jgi:ParB-like chromosome segregation protein Spo0J
MNDFELNYLHYARSEELIKQAEHERQARELVKAAKATRRGANVRHEGLAARVAKAFGRGERTGESAGGRGSARVQPAK